LRCPYTESALTGQAREAAGRSDPTASRATQPEGLTATTATLTRAWGSQQILLRGAESAEPRRLTIAEGELSCEPPLESLALAVLEDC